MIDPMIVATAAVLVIGALTTAAIKIIESLSKMKQEIAKKLDDAAKSQVEIHTLVNSNAKEAAEKLIAVEKKLQELNDQLIALQELRIEDAKRVTRRDVTEYVVSEELKIKPTKSETDKESDETKQ